MKIRNVVKLFTVCGLAMTVSFTACNSSKKNVPSEDEIVSNGIDTMKLNLDVTSLDTLKLLYPDSENQLLIEEPNKGKVGEMLTQLVNDTAWNNSGIMVKMVAPDYMLILQYKGKSQDENGWVSMWKELGKAKVDNKWYLLPDNKEEFFKLLDGYRK